jgi:biopolymer transport protein ExbD
VSIRSIFTAGSRRRRRADGNRAARRSSGRKGYEARGVSIAVNFAPMIDVTFLLLIFFLVTTTFERAEGILAGQMPRDSRAPAVSLPLSPIIVRVEQIGPEHDDYEIRIDRFTLAPASSAELTDALQQIHGQPGFDEKTPVVIVAENEVRWDHVVGCWNAALRAGCERIAFGEP